MTNARTTEQVTMGVLVVGALLVALFEFVAERRRPAPVPVVCPLCGTGVDPALAFCGMCGARVTV